MESKETLNGHTRNRWIITIRKINSQCILSCCFQLSCQWRHVEEERPSKEKQKLKSCNSSICSLRVQYSVFDSWNSAGSNSDLVQSKDSYLDNLFLKVDAAQRRNCHSDCDDRMRTGLQLSGSLQQFTWSLAKR